MNMFQVSLSCWLFIFVALMDFEEDFPSLNLVYFTVDLGTQPVSRTTETDTEWGAGVNKIESIALWGLSV